LCASFPCRTFRAFTLFIFARTQLVAELLQTWVFRNARIFFRPARSFEFQRFFRHAGSRGMLLPGFFSIIGPASNLATCCPARKLWILMSKIGNELTEQYCCPGTIKAMEISRRMRVMPARMDARQSGANDAHGTTQTRRIYKSKERGCRIDRKLHSGNYFCPSCSRYSPR
jgi:hypothetical protein